VRTGWPGLDRFGGRIPNLLGNTLRLQHLTAADAEAAIRKPLDVYNGQQPDAAPVAIEDALVGAVIDQVRSGQVTLSRSGGVGQAGRTDETLQIEAPCLQLVMRRLWEEEMDSGSRTLRLATLERLGGAEKIVRKHLDEVMDGLEGARQGVCAKFFDRLVTPSGTKIACSLTDLAVFAGLDTGEVAPILETLCKDRILRGVATPGAKSDTSYEIYNDVLAPAILDWRRGYLQAQERAEAERRAAEQAQAEAKATYAKRLRFYKWSAVGVAVVAGFLFLWVSWLRLQEAAHRRQIHALELAEAAQNVLEGDAELGTLLAIEAVRAADSVEGAVPDTAANILQLAVNTPRADKQLSGLAGAPSAMFFNADGTRLVATGLGTATWISDPAAPRPVFTSRATTIVWDAATGSRVREITSETPVSGLTLSPDGRRLAKARWDGAVQVFDLATGKSISTMAHNKVVSAVFSPKGQRIATVSSDGSATVSDVESGKQLLPIGAEVNKHITDLAFSPDSKWLAIASRDQKYQTTVTVLDADGSELFKQSVPGPSIALTFDSQSNRLANLNRIRPDIDNLTVWEVPSGNLLTPGGHYSLADFSPDGSLLAGVSEDGSVHLWRFDNGIRELRTFFSHTPWRPTAQARQVVFKDLSKIATVGADGTARIWDLRSGRELLPLQGVNGHPVVKVAFRPGSAQIAAAGGDGTVSLWNLDDSHAGAILFIAFSRDGHRLATSGDDGTLKIWNADTLHVLGTLTGEGSELTDVYALAFDADGSRLFAASSEGRLTVWDLTDLNNPPKRKDFFSVGIKNGVTLVLSEDGNSLVTAGEEGAARVWDVTKANHPSRRFGGPEKVWAFALSENGRRLATVNQDRDRVQIWDEGMTKDSWSISGQGLDAGKDVKFWDVALSPDGRYLMSHNEKGPILLWDVCSKKPGAMQRLWAVLRPMLLWDVCSKKPLSLPADFLKYANVRSGLAFSPDGDHLATATAKTVVVWDIANRVAKYIDAADVTTLAFSRDGKRLATAGRKGTVQIWSLAPNDLVARAQTLTTRFTRRSLDLKECNQYHIEPCPASK
jgi:WD40 repeat protein